MTRRILTPQRSMKIAARFKETYRDAIPFALRKNFWGLRAAVGRAPIASKWLAVKFWRKGRELSSDLAVRLTGHCNACRSKNITRYRNPATAHVGYNFYICRDCRFIFVAPTPEILSHYANQAMPDFGEGERVWTQHYLDAINRHSEIKGKLLEVGFGNASFLKLAYEDGWDTHGSELSIQLVRQAREGLKLPNIELGSIEEIGYPDDFFDVVAGFNFLEHVRNPRNILLEVRRILRPSGLVALMVPNITGIYHQLTEQILGDNDPLKITWVPPDHLSYFSKNNLTILLESVGFTVISDQSQRMSSLWRQHEVNLGPKVTDEKLEGLLSEIRSSTFSRGEGRTLEYRQRIKKLLVERMAWTMVSDLMELEPALGSENALLFLAEKVSR